MLVDLTVALAVAWIAGAIAVRLRVNPILGYLIGGSIIGPFTPGYVAHGETINDLANVGLIFLLFSLGLGFSFGEIRRLGVIAVSGNLGAMAIFVGAAYGAARALGLPHPLTLGITTAVSSTAVGVALLQRWHVEEKAPGRFAVAQQVVQDLVAVALLVLATAKADSISLVGIGWPVAKAVLFVGVALILGATVLHKIVSRTLTQAEPDRLIVAFGGLSMIAAWIGNVAGLSYEFGAFVAGAVISEAAGSKMVATVVAPFKALFVALFFVSVGMLLDFSVFRAHAAAIIIGAVVFAAFRFALWNLLSRQAGLSRAAAILSALAMTSLGEFNVVLVNEAAHAGRLNAEEQAIMIGIIVFSIGLSVLAGSGISKILPPDKLVLPPAEGTIADAAAIVIIGFGRVGKTVGMVLRNAGVPFVALEQDRTIVDDARRDGFSVVYGNASDPAAIALLLQPTTKVALVTLPDSEASLMAAKFISERGKIRVVARARSARDIDVLRAGGAEQAFVPESEGALAFAGYVLRSIDVDQAVINANIATIRAMSMESGANLASALAVGTAPQTQSTAGTTPENANGAAAE